MTNPIFAQDLYEGFQNPGSEARPRVWWHWMNGNITKDGIRKDLEWMHRVGIGGVHNFDAGLQSPQIVEKRVEYMTPEWKEIFQYSTFLADSLGMEYTIASAPGWSATGGPWVEAKDGMKKLTWREITVEGQPAGKKKMAVQKIQLPEPFKHTGVFLDLPQGDTETSLGGAFPNAPTYYEDLAVIAVRHADADRDMRSLGATLTTSGDEGITLEAMTDGRLTGDSKLLAVPNSSYGWIEYTFPEPHTIRAMRLATDRKMGVFAGRHSEVMATLWASDDGKDYRYICDVHTSYVLQQTISVPATTARHFRLRIENPKPDMSLAAYGRIGEAPKYTGVTEFELFTATRINHAEEKAGFHAVTDLTDFPTPSSEVDAAARIEDVIDLTDKVNADGMLVWEVPDGQWTIYRMGWSLTGKMNHPASYEATGLEVDKLDPIAWSNYLHTYINMYKEAAGGLLGQKGIQYILTDSFEAGQETWTPAMRKEFKSRRGYDLLPWMPVLTGRIIGSVAQSEQFLFDWRMTIGELIAENFDRMTEICKEYGMKGRYSEAHEGSRAFIVDGMDVKRTSAIPMAAMWTFPADSKATQDYRLDIMESASVAHIYGQNLVAAESMTANGVPDNAYAFHPGNLKRVVDAEFAAGLNRVVVHCSPHQPDDTHKPGLSLMIFGQWYTRHETWAEQAKAWNDYMARTSYMLQQGHFVADVLYYYGEDTNVFTLINQGESDIPRGYAWDYCNPHALMNMVSPHRNQAGQAILTTESGMSYRILALNKNVKYMSLPVLRRIKELADAGTVICGAMPEKPAGQRDDTDEWYRLIDLIWHTDRPNVSTLPVAQALAALGVRPDFTHEKSAYLDLPFVHRTIDDGEIYWVQNPTTQSLRLKARFRTTGRKPYIWHPEDGSSEEASYRMTNDGYTEVTLPMVSEDALFVVFTEKTDIQSMTLPERELHTLVEINTPWTVRFAPNLGAPEQIRMQKLLPLNEHEEAGVRYYSGTATYLNTVLISRAQLAQGKQFMIDLGEVGNLAEVIVNGKNMGISWHAPYKLDITSALKAGKNDIEIRVTNDWRNRIIGDAQPDASEKITFTVRPFYRANASLQPSGLMSSVKILVSMQH